ncbi:transcriptional regulator, AraC family protein [Verrucomicrobiia bacterium DG1235]|nr:transcriptional regulator, AraC family protein [Verrucomicrobiae bacterium DG1235]
MTEEEGHENESLEVYCAGWEDCAEDYRIERESFPYLAIEFIAGGEWELSFQGKKRVLSPGCVFSYGPGVAYRLRPLSRSGLSKYFVDFAGSDAERRLEEAKLSPGTDCLIFQHRWIRELFDQIVEIRLLAPSARKRLARLTLELLLARLPEHMGEGEYKAQAWLSFERCRNYLSENYLEQTSLAEVATACGVSAAYLSRLFARFSNETPKAYLDRMKMNYAAQKLLRGNLQVKQAAAEVGYADVFHFSRVFKKCFGVPPSTFAKRAGQGGKRV